MRSSAPSESPAFSQSILDKPRLFSQLGMPACQSPSKVSWTRSADFFGDGFKLVAVATRESISAQWVHTRPNGHEQTIWTLSIDQSPTGRARVLSCEGFSPPLRSVQRAAEAIRLAIFQTQAAPLVQPLGKPSSGSGAAPGPGVRSF